MSKVIKTNKSKGIIAVNSKDKYLQQLKLMSNYLVTQDERVLNRLSLETDIQKGNSLKRRSISHLLFYPKIIHYINEYLNNWFDIENCSLKDFLYTISLICKQYKIDTTSKLYYSKTRIEETDEFMSLIQKYYNEIGLDPPSIGELYAFLNLYKAGIITETLINDITNIITANIEKPPVQQQFRQFIPTTTDVKEEETLSFENLSPKVKEYIGIIKNYIKSKCKHCPMYNKGSVILDTNLQEPGPVDILLIGLNPGSDELKKDLPFIGKSGQLLRKYLNPLIQKYHLSYIITNSILCSSANAQEIPNISQVTKNCKPLVDEIRRMFPSKLTIVLGNEAKTSLGIKGAITKLNGEYFEGYFIILHPSAILYNPNNLPKFEKAFQNLDILISKNEVINMNKKEMVTKIENIKENIPKDRIVTRFSQDLSLFDIKLIDEQVIYILKDPKGNKKYLFEQFSMPVFVKSGQYKECHIIEKNVDAFCKINNEERIRLSKMLYYYNNKKDR